MTYETKTERTSDINHSTYDASNDTDSLYVHNMWYHMPSFMAVGNNFWQTKNMNTDYCIDLSSTELRYRNSGKFLH
jgi:hypothetical protein